MPHCGPSSYRCSAQSGPLFGISTISSAKCGSWRHSSRVASRTTGRPSMLP